MRRRIHLKIGSPLVMLALVLGVIGAGLSYSGYNESLQMITSPVTATVTATSTRILTSSTQELIIRTTSSTEWILQDEIFNIPAGTTQRYCGYYDARHVYVNAGQVHVSYSTDSAYHLVDFWMMNEDDFTRWTKTAICANMLAFQGSRKPFVAKLGASGYEFTTEVPSAVIYYFVFMNENRYPIDVTLNVDAGIQTSEVTITRATTFYSTQMSPYVAQRVTSSRHPAGFGLLFYSGIGLVVIAGIVLAVGRRKGAAPGFAGRAPSPPKPSEAEPARGKFCMNCGAALPAHATFCNKCGTKQ